MIVPGIVSATFKAETPDYVLSAMREAGLTAVEWSENWHVPAGDTSLAAELRDRTLAQGAQVAAYGSYYRLGQNRDPEQDFLPSLRSAAAMQAPVIRIWGGSLPSAGLEPAQRESLAREAGTVSRMAAESGIRVALEWHKNTVTDTNESARAFLEEAGADNLYCLWQPTVALDMAQRCAGIRMLEEKDRLLNLHVYYWRQGKRRPFREGLDEWTRYLQQLDPDKTRFGLLEFVLGDTRAQFLEDAEQWKNLLRQTHHYGVRRE